MIKASYNISYGAQSAAGAKCDVDFKKSLVYFLQRKLSCSLQFVDFADQKRKRFKSLFWLSTYQKIANCVLDTEYTDLSKAFFISECHTGSSRKVKCNPSKTYGFPWANFHETHKVYSDFLPVILPKSNYKCGMCG